MKQMAGILLITLGVLSQNPEISPMMIFDDAPNGLAITRQMAKENKKSRKGKK